MGSGFIRFIFFSCLLDYDPKRAPRISFWSGASAYRTSCLLVLPEKSVS